jgi:hypothetical protein
LQYLNLVLFFRRFTMKFKVQSAPSQTKLFGGLVIAASLMFSQAVFAAGTASNTLITNSATLNFSVGGVGQTPVLSDGDTVAAGVQTTDFRVDNKINLTVIEANATFTTVVPGETAAVTTFTVTNNGNTVQDYSLVGTATGLPGTIFTVADNFDATGCSTFVESLAIPNGYTPGVDTATFIDELAADATKTVYVVCNIPITQLNGDQSNTQLTATTLAGGAAGIGAAVSQAAPNTQAGVEIVFADPATAASVDGTIPLQTARDAIGFARDAYRVVSATLAVTKTVTPICDPFNGSSGPKNIPGAAVQYAITIVNSGGANATLTSIADALDVARLTFNTNLISGAGAGGNCVSGTGSLSASGFGAVKGTGATTYSAPGLAAQATTAGATFTSPNVAVNFSTLATSTITAPAAATLAPGDFITVYFNSFIQ